MDPRPKDPQEELETALSELESRLDRLRALYEQFFMGFERLEPSVQRKDVDRRFSLLKKTQIRNTATRFRLNVLSQRYSTYALYWARVCRQIEAGTYTRHVTKAAKRFGPKAAPPVEEAALELDIDVDLADLDDTPPPSSREVLAPPPSSRDALAPPSAGGRQPLVVRRRTDLGAPAERVPASTPDPRAGAPRSSGYRPAVIPASVGSGPGSTRTLRERAASSEDPEVSSTGRRPR